MTILLRRCMYCRTLYGLRLARGRIFAWSSLFEVATTHGICRRCDRGEVVV